MLATNSELLNSCRVCRSPNQDGEYECLYVNSQSTDEKPELSEAGILYENLLDIQLNMWNYYPQYLCNSCDLQMKLFKKLKDKAYKTLEYLQNIHEKVHQTSKNFKEEENIEALEEVEGSEFLHKQNIRDSSTTLFLELEEEHIFGVTPLDQAVDNEICLNNIKIEESGLGNGFVDEGLSCEKENQIEICAVSKREQLEMNSYSIREESRKQESLEANNAYEEVQATANTVEKMSEITLELDTNSVIDKNDYVTEIYVANNDTIDENAEVIEDYDVYIESNTENSSVYNDVEYVLDEITDTFQNHEEESNDLVLKDSNAAKKIKKTIKENSTKKKKYQCGPCQLVFTNMQEFKNHRKDLHNEKYPCSLCSKELKSQPALHTHMKLHNDKPAYQCEICQKSFSQKHNFQYHMNRHNNVRNFKCSDCEKAFLSKSDLKIHMRSHTGHRPYACSICGKDYLMMEHLKAHALIHSQEYFQCEICLHKFATHKTLRTHIKSIHEEEPRFKCNHCPKAFRRKHHLEYHLRLHEKNEQFLENGFELLYPGNPDDCEPIVDYTTEDLIDQELVDDPGFIAL